MENNNRTEKLLYIIIGLLIAIAAVIIFASPNNKKETPVETKTTVVLERKNISLVVGDTSYVKYIISPSTAIDKNVSFKSSNPNIVSVEADGKITGLAPGNATIIVKSLSSGMSEECLITVVEKKIPITSISLSSDDLVLNVGESLDLKVTVKPANATDEVYTWTSSDSSVATVENGKITAKKSGTTLITVITSNKKIAICDVTVGINVEKISFDVSSVKMAVDNEYKLKPTITPSNATEPITWSSSNESILSVNNGLVIAKNTGTAIVTLKSQSGVKARVEFTVKAKKPGIETAFKKELNNINFDNSGKTIVFGSDYQGTSRKDNFKAILNNLKKNNISPSLISILGDYQNSGTSKNGSVSGLKEANEIIRSVYSNTGNIFIQGNHDPKENTYLTATGGYEAKNYVIYAINEDDYPSSSGSPTNTVKKTTGDLDSYLANMVDLNIKKPVFVITHVPLHSSSRNDNRLSYLMVDVLNKYGKKLDIIFMFGHNHSSHYDDCFGGAINYIKKGSNLKYSAGLTSINFTYMNAGYIGWSNNTKGVVTCSGSKVDSTNNLTMSVFKIEESKIQIERYSKNGIVFTDTITRIN